MDFFRFLGNIVWFILCGFISGLAWLAIGLIWCITIIGIPVGIQCLKLSCVSFFPFGKNILLGTKTSSLLLNILWAVFGGLELAIGYLAAGIVLCCTIIGIPLGLQCFTIKNHKGNLGTDVFECCSGSCCLGNCSDSMVLNLVYAHRYVGVCVMC